MAIINVEIEDFLLFKSKFAVDFCFGVNVLIGGNGTGKTTLMKAMYNTMRTIEYVRREYVFNRPRPVGCGMAVVATDVVCSCFTSRPVSTGDGGR